MGKPKKQTTRRRTGNRRSHHFAKLARAVNRASPVKVRRPAAASPIAANQIKVVAKRTDRRGNK